MEMNYLSILIAALVPMLMGFIWYHEKVFGKPWMNELGFNEETMANANMLKIFGIAFLSSLLQALGLTAVATHDAFIHGALYYITNKTGIPEPLSEPAKWLEYYNANLKDSNHTFKHGMAHGLLISGLFAVVPVLITDGLFERRSFKFLAIKIGFWMVCLGIMGGIIASMAK